MKNQFSKLKINLRKTQTIDNRKIDKVKLKEQVRQYSEYINKLTDDQLEPDDQNQAILKKSKTLVNPRNALIRKLTKETEQNKIVPQYDGIYEMKFNFNSNLIMQYLSKERLQILSKIWFQKEVGLTAKEIIKHLLDRITTENDEEKYELMYGAFELYSEVDINGDGILEWREFMQYIIDVVEATVFKEGGTNNESVQEQLEAMNALRYQRFQVKQKPLDQSKHHEVIMQTVLCPEVKLVMLFEKYQKEFKVYDYNMSIVKTIDVPFKTEAFILSIAYDEKNQYYCALGSDSVIYFFIKSNSKFKFLKQINIGKIAGCKQLKVWYLYQKKLWLTAGEDFNLREWDFSEKGEIKRKFWRPGGMKHTDLITDCINIEIPSNSIVTCSLDTTIMVHDTAHDCEPRVISGWHETGIRKISYQRQNGNTMVSIGNEIYANVWQPESLVSDVHIGRLNGHKVSIVDGSFLNKAPFFVTVDIENNVLFWDIKQLQCVQVIQANLNKQTLGICILNQGLIWLYSKRFTQIDNKNLEDDEENDPDDQKDLNNPFFVQFNQYTYQQIVVSKKDIKMYDAQTGKIQSIFNNVFKKQDFSKLEITSFKIDKRHRKAYVANNLGEVYLINAQNGVIIKNVTQYLEDKKNIEAFQNENGGDDQDLSSLGSSRYIPSDEEIDIYADTPADNQLSKDKTNKKDKQDRKDYKEMMKEVKQMAIENNKFEHENELDRVDLQIKGEQKEDSILDNQIQLDDNPELFDVILVWENDIQMMFCANKREFFIWDERNEGEQSKMLRRISGGHQEEITILQYDHHLSLFATGCVNGEITLYDFEMSRVEGILRGHTGDVTCIKFLSPNPLLISSSMDHTVCIWAVRPCPEKLKNVCLKRFINQSWTGKKDEPIVVTTFNVWREEMEGIKYFRRSYDKTLKAEAYRKFEYNFVFGQMSVYDIFKKEIRPEMATFEPDPPNDVIFNQVIETQTYKDLLSNEDSQMFITSGETQPFEYNQTLDEVKERIYLIIGDERGYVKIWDLEPTLKELMRQYPRHGDDCGLCPVQPVIETRGAFNPFRLEKVNCSDQTKVLRELKQPPLPPIIDPSISVILIKEVRAHFDVIKSIDSINHEGFRGISTLSYDGKLRNWTLELDLLGSIRLEHERIDKKWRFDLKGLNKKRQENLDELQKIMEGYSEAELGLTERKKKLVASVQEIKQEEEEIKEEKSTSWIDQQKEIQAQERLLVEEKEQMRKKIELDAYKQKMVKEKIKGLIYEHAYQYNNLRNEVPEILTDHPALLKTQEGFKDVKSARDLQLELNKQHEKFVTITEESESKAEAKNKKSPNRKMTRLFSNLDTVIVEPKKAKKKTLAQIVTEQDSHPQKGKFDVSKNDRSSILGNQNLPSIRTQLKSINNPKFRFNKQSPEIQEIQSQYNQLVKSTKYSQRNKDRELMPFSINDSEIQISGKSEYNHASLKKSFEKIIRSRSRLPAIISPMNQVNSQRVFEFNSYINSPNNQENLYVELSPSERTRDEIDDRKTKLNEYKVNLAFSQAGYSPSQLISRNPFGQSQATMPKQESANSQSLLEIARRNNSNNILTYDQGDMSSVKRNKKNDDFKKFFTSEQSTHEQSKVNLGQLKNVSTIDYKNRSRLENFKSNNPFNIDSNSAFLNDRFKSKSELGHKSSFIKNMESHVSIQSRISNEEERKKKYEAIKEKYCGASPTLDAESLRFKTNQEDILKNFQKLKKLKLKTLK